ncbi:MAG: diacylglycerol kinase family protein [Myxococcota bacterium]|nr:diacylglycerol kinase family protein [Myxococcota bacterium]
MKRLREKKSPKIPAYPALSGGSFWDGLLHAWNGLVHTIVYQRNMRIHMVAAVLVGLVGSGIPLGLAEKVIMIFCVLMVFFAEILNTALEQLVDLAIQQFDEKARITKDAAAAGVLVLAGGTTVIFAAILVNNWETVPANLPGIVRQVALGIPLTVCAAALMMPVEKPRWLDALVFAGATGLMWPLMERSHSYVFSAMTYALVVLAFASALERQKLGPRK